MLSIMKVIDGIRGCRFKCKQNRERTNVRIEGVISKLLVLPSKSLPLRPRVLCDPFLFLYWQPASCVPRLAELLA
jgi:hypothetical protein